MPVAAFLRLAGRNGRVGENFGPVSAVVEGLVVLVRRVEDMVS